MSAGVAITRPNGKQYRPRKTPYAVQVPDLDEECDWVYVFGTHDIALARTLAQPANGTYLVDPTLSWVRPAIRNDESVYIVDKVRGAACVIFTEADDPVMHADSRACDPCYRELPEQYESFPTLCPHRTHLGGHAL